jgi:hypothetical protein
MLYVLVLCICRKNARPEQVISPVTCCRILVKTPAGGTDYGKNYRKKKQKSKSTPGSCRGNIRHTAGKRKNHPIIMMIIAMIRAWIPIRAVSLSMQ